MPIRIYRVINAETAAEHLVRASSQAQAIRHVVKGGYHAVVAGQETIVELLTSGVRVEDASQPLTDEQDEFVEIDGEPGEVAA